MNQDVSSCPECGADQATMTCVDRLGLLLAWEVDDEALRAVHFLTVASYNLQHPAAFTNDAIAGLRDALRGYLDGHLSIADIRRRAGSARRILRPGGPGAPSLRTWSMTIEAVATPDAAAGAADRVRAWAETIRNAAD
jgi:hypothetical protein